MYSSWSSIVLAVGLQGVLTCLIFDFEEVANEDESINSCTRLDL